MIANSVHEEVKLDAMQRVWQSSNRRLVSSLSVFEESSGLGEDFCPLPRQNSCSAIGKSAQLFGQSRQSAAALTFSDDVDDADHLSLHDELQEIAAKRKLSESYTILDAKELGDFPAQYKICRLQSHELPVIGVYIDKRVVPGFKYRVRPLPNFAKPLDKKPYLFEGKACTLSSIGRGYARRFTFAEKNNYFWSDNNPDGFSFEIEAISVGDKFTIFDVDQLPQGTAEILKIEAPQVETNCFVNDGQIEKKVKVKFTAKIEFYETGVAKPMPVSGTAIVVKKKGSNCAQVTRLSNVNIKHHRYYLTPGFQNGLRRVTVRGEDINDVPTKYTMTGLEPYEIPIVGTYVDPRIIPGFSYRVRPNDRRDHLFNGRALRLISIGMGYAKRLTFEPDSLVEPNNYLWSDSHPDGLGLEPIAVQKGMRFEILAGDQRIGEAEVFRADQPQVEERMESIETPSGKLAIIKYIHANIICCIKLRIDDRIEELLVGVYGLAVVRKEPRSNVAKIIRVENVALDSQINMLFAWNHTNITFKPL